MNNFDQTNELIKQGNLAEIEAVIAPEEAPVETPEKNCQLDKLRSLTDAKEILQSEIEKINEKIADAEFKSARIIPLYDWLQENYGQLVPAEFRHPNHEGPNCDVYLEGTEIVLRNWDNEGPNGYQVLSREVIGKLPENLDIVSIPGTILASWDADFSKTYLGSKAKIGLIRQSLDKYYRAIHEIENLLGNRG